MGCFRLSQDTAPPYIVDTQPVVLRQVSIHAAKLASHQSSMGAAAWPYVSPLAAVLPTYRTIVDIKHRFKVPRCGLRRKGGKGTHTRRTDRPRALGKVQQTADPRLELYLVSTLRRGHRAGRRR